MPLSPDALISIYAALSLVAIAASGVMLACELHPRVYRRGRCWLLRSRKQLAMAQRRLDRWHTQAAHVCALIRFNAFDLAVAACVRLETGLGRPMPGPFWLSASDSLSLLS